MILNDLTMTFTSRLKMDAKCANQQCNWIKAANCFGHPQLIECMGICVLSLVSGSERIGSVYLLIVKRKRGHFCLKSAAVRALG